MKNEIIDIWSRLTFKTVSYKKNFDLIDTNEKFITEYSGTISEVRIAEYKPPIIAGEYGYSVWDIELAQKLELDLNKLITRYTMQNTYNELLSLTTNGKFNINSYSKIVLIHNLVIKPSYRKIGITEEFIESIFREFHGENVAIIALVKPIQYNVIDYDYYHNNIVQVRHDIEKPNEYEKVKAFNYYGLDAFETETDDETNMLKLYALASRCGFNRMDESNLFLLNGEKIIKRIKEKTI